MKILHERSIHLAELFISGKLYIENLALHSYSFDEFEFPRAFPYILVIIFTAFTISVIHIQYIAYWSREIVISSK
jgi:hypothetical protein